MLWVRNKDNRINTTETGSKLLKTLKTSVLDMAYIWTTGVFTLLYISIAVDTWSNHSIHYTL